MLKVGYEISFFGVLKIKIKLSHLFSMVWVVFLPEVEIIYCMCQMKVNDYYVNIPFVIKRGVSTVR